MTKWSICILLLAILSSGSATAAAESVSKKEFQAYQELTQTKLDAAQASASKDQQILQMRLDSQDKRLDDQQSRIGDIGLYLALFGILITLVVAALGLIGYFSVRNRAREEACEVARAESKKWFDQEAQSLKLKISGFERELAAQKEVLGHKADQHGAVMQAKVDEVTILAAQTQKQILQEKLSRPTTEQQPITATTPESKALDEVANQLRDKPESEYNFDDWENRAYAAFQSHQLEEAAYFLQRAIEMPNIKPSDIARALVNKGVVLSELGRSEEEIATYNDLLARFGDTADSAVHVWVANALFNKGITFGQLARREDEIAAYNDLMAHFSDTDKPVLHERIAKALVNKGFALGQLKRSEEEIAAYDDLLAHFGETTESALLEPVASGLLNKGITLSQLGRGEEAITVYDNLLARFGEATEPALREQVAMALLNKGAALGKLGQGEEAIAVCDDLLARFGGATEPELREQVASGLFNKGISLGRLGRGEAAIAAYDDLLTRFGDATEPRLRKHVAKAHNKKGFALLCFAKEQWQETSDRTNRLVAAKDCFAAAIDKCDSDTSDLRGTILGNQAYAAALSGESMDQVRDALHQALTIGCENLYKSTLKSLDISPVPEDASFRILLDAVWAEVKPICEAHDKA